MGWKSWATLMLSCAALAGCVEAAVIGAGAIIADDIMEKEGGGDGLF